MGLCAIFDDPELVLGSNRHDRIHGRRLAVKMHRNNPNRARGDSGLDPLWVDCKGFYVRIAKDDFTSRLGDGF